MGKFLKHIMVVLLLVTGVVANSRVHSHAQGLVQKTPDTFRGVRFGGERVHHAIEQQINTRYPNLFTEVELHSLENLRGILKAINSDVHLSKIRVEWNKFYSANANPTKAQVLQKAKEIDDLFGSQFYPPVR